MDHQLTLNYLDTFIQGLKFVTNLMQIGAAEQLIMTLSSITSSIMLCCHV